MTSLALAPDGRLVVAYSDQAALRVAVRGDADWEIETAATSPGRTFGQQVSLAVGPDGAMHVATFDWGPPARVFYLLGQP